jgi:protein involved in polysaccharide export with SLBB domain
LIVFLLLYLALGRDLPAQTQITADCSDPFMEDTAECTVQPQESSALPATLPAQGITQPSNVGSRGTYSDVAAGSPRSASPNPAQSLPAEGLTEFQKLTSSTAGETLHVFGMDLFRQVPSTFAPLTMTPVPADYVVGPGDELRIRVWGQVNFQVNLQVDRSGEIFLPQVGPVHIEGLRFADLLAHLRTEIGRLYHNFDLTADIGQTRSIQVFVTGQARRPGVYTVSSLTTLVDALFASGGPSAQGSLRHIELRRANTLVTDFDLYDLLTRGDKSKDVKLLPGDVIFIPPVGPQVALTGSVRNPGIYELRGEVTISTLVSYAGGLSNVANGARVSLERIEEHQYRQAMEIAYDQQGAQTLLTDGDLIRFFSLMPVYHKTVILRGHTANPGRFAWHPGMRLSELIPDKAALITRDYWWKRMQMGLPTPEFQGEQPAAGSQALSGFNLQSRGVQGRAVATTETQSAMTTRGVTDAVPTRVEVLSPEIDWDYAVIERLDPETLKTELLPFDLGKLVLSHDPSQDLELQNGDAVTIFSEADIRVPVSKQTKLVRLDGEIAHAGVYSLQPGETLRQLIARAGGLANHAYLYGSELTRISTQAIQQARIDEYVQMLTMQIERNNMALAGQSASLGTSGSAGAQVAGSEQGLLRSLQQLRATGRIVLPFKPENQSIESVPDIALEDGDHFTVPSVPGTVNVVGAVYNQNSFLYMDSRRVSTYLKLAGGPNREADRRHAFIIRADGEVISSSATTSLWESDFENLRVYPGDTVVVPEKLIKPSAMRGIADWSQVFSQLALGAVALNVVK